MALTDLQNNVLCFVVNELDKEKISYQVSGGTAAILHGVNRETSDIDIDIHQADFPQVERLFREYVTHDYHKYFDEKDMDFDIWMMNLNIDGVEVEFGQAEEAKILGIGNTVWTPLPITIQNAEIIRVGEVEVRVQSKRDLIEYKKILGRDVDKVDVADLERMV
jgi:hypothetical protein